MIPLNRWEDKKSKIQTQSGGLAIFLFPQLGLMHPHQARNSQQKIQTSTHITKTVRFLWINNVLLIFTPDYTTNYSENSTNFGSTLWIKKGQQVKLFYKTFQLIGTNIINKAFYFFHFFFYLYVFFPQITVLLEG